MKPLVIFGAADVAELADHYFQSDGGRTVAAFALDAAYLKEATFKGRPTVAFETVERAFSPDRYDLFVAVAYTQLNRLRAAKMQEAEAKGYALASYVSSRAYVWNGLVPAPNQFILEHNTLQPFCRVGRGVTLWSGNHIGHHSVVEDHCFISSHVVISGHVRVGAESFIGVNATLRDGIAVGQRCVIGAGAVVLDDVPDETVFRAAPTEASKVPSTRLRKI